MSFLKALFENNKKVMGKLYLLILLFLFPVFLISCYHANIILDKQDFETGKWLLIDRNSVSSTCRGITDSKILKEYSRKLIVIHDENDNGTTCDGVIELYKNGKLINSQEYLSNIRLLQPNSLKKYYSPCEIVFLKVPTKNIKPKIIDSLLNSKDCYPIVNPNTTEDTSTISYFKFR